RSRRGPSRARGPPSTAQRISRIARRELDGCSTQLWLLNCRYRSQEREALRGSRAVTEENHPVQLHPITRRLVAPIAVAVALLAVAAGSASASLVPDDDGW